MCSIVEDDFGDDGGVHAMKEDTPQPQLVENELCRKCNVEQAVLKLDHKEPQCRMCFLNYVRHKFRASLGSSKIVRRGSRVLIILTGTPENVALLDMVRFGLEQDAFKQLRIEPVLMFVDDDFLSKTAPERKEKLAILQDILRQFNFPAHYTVSGSTKVMEFPFDSAFTPPESFALDETRLKEIINGTRSVTSKQDLLEQVRKQTYQAVARSLNCNYVFLSDIGIDLAKTLLSHVALGRGCSIAQDVAFCDDRYGTVKLIRPIRDLNPDEITHYLKLAEKQHNTIPRVDHFADRPSLQNLTAKFIDHLQGSFPSTVSTIYRTGDKLDAVQPTNTSLPEASTKVDILGLLEKKKPPTPLDGGHPEQCVFCGAVLDYRGSKTLYATEYSRLVSSRVNASCSHEDILVKSKQMELDAARMVNGEDEDELSKLKKNLCHGCRNIFVDQE
ncbi:cytoplasmic tRNA 2-thiolation protein 2 [Anopheles aquasalis]|uniref:cytoplasmic tRNA 2-thiolation protein 2 n=1 Tax=Anopheles aquasalis TaxID=42839 RepID=UPI00215A0DB1|nr:cytoplasmic tRNA 2-thiolation protein 2 [Anopheles aquasalis]